MPAFTPLRLTRSATIHLNAAPATVFPLFTPLGERLWIPDWNPTIIYPPSGAAELDAVFTTAHEDVYGGEFMVGLIEDQIVAMGALRRTTAERAAIKRMRVHPDHQGRGYGQTLLTYLEARARALGYKTLHLSTTDRQ